MRIHTVQEGESIQDIAKAHGINEDIISIANEIENNTLLSVGEELLILTPTRTYTAKDGDTFLKISLRFGVSLNQLKSNNPHIPSCTPKPGQEVIIHFDEKAYGTGVSNGIFYKNCPRWKLTRAMPYMTYVTVGSGIYDGEKIYESFNTDDIVKFILENGKMPLLRIYNKSDNESYRNKGKRAKYINSIIEIAKKRGYKGITLGYPPIENEEINGFLVELKGQMIGQDLILISEMLPESNSDICDYSDGTILMYNKCASDAFIYDSFDTAERKILDEYALKCESTKTFIELPVFAKCKSGKYIEISEATDMARRIKSGTTANKETLISSFQHKKHGSIEYNTLSNIKRRLDMLAENGYMGISFDIGRCPLSYLMMYECLFKSVGYANVENNLKCNPDTVVAKTN